MGDVGEYAALPVGLVAARAVPVESADVCAVPSAVLVELSWHVASVNTVRVDRPRAGSRQYIKETILS